MGALEHFDRMESQECDRKPKGIEANETRQHHFGVLFISYNVDM